MIKPRKSAAESQRGTQENTDQSLASRPKENDSKSPKLGTAPSRSDEKSDSRAQRVTSPHFDYDLHDYQKRLKVGKIGGKAKADPIDVPKSPHRVNAIQTHAELEQDSSPTERPDHPRLQTSPATKPDQSNQAYAKRESLSPSLDETEMERADRKREQIKRALEAKAAAPAKKKQRRF